MATIYTGAASDGWVFAGAATWGGTRQATTGLSTRDNERAGLCTRVGYSVRGGGSYMILRAFFLFDTSGISITPSEATLNITGYYWGTSDVIAVRSEQGTTLSTADFDALYGASTAITNSDGTGTGTLAGISGLAYSSEVTSWNTSGYNNIELNATALADMASLDTFKVAIIDYDYDYLDITVGTSTYISGCYFSDEPGTSKDPYIDYTAGVPVIDNAVFFGANF